MKSLIIRGVLVVIAVAAVIGAWQIAYARGHEEGVVVGAATRAEFVQARQGDGVAAGGGGGGGGGFAKPGAAGTPGTGGGGGGGGFAKPGGGGGGGVNGRVEKVEGTTLTVATSEGSVTVTLADSTMIRRTVNATPGDIQVGDRVLVIGERKSDTEVAANTVQIQPQ